MSEQEPVYKAILRVPLDSTAQSLIRQWKALQLPTMQLAINGIVKALSGQQLTSLQSSFLDDIFEIAERSARTKAMADAAGYLDSIDRFDHFINTYAAIDRDTEEVTITHVLSNRDTALMLKLALG